MKTKPTKSRAGVASAAPCSPCDGCQWQHAGEAGNYCYMFQSAPIMLPCTQHDKFKETRDMLSAVVRKRPAILAMMVMGHLSETNTEASRDEGGERP